MKEFNAKIVEKYGYKANRKGFFKEWQELSSSIKDSRDIRFDDAAELAYKQLKVQGSE